MDLAAGMRRRRRITIKKDLLDFYAPQGCALILEGGAMRGVFEAGVLDAFLSKGLHFRHVVGTSVGTMQAMCYLSGQKGRNIRINATYCRDPRYMGIKHLLKEKNYFNFDFMFGELAHQLDPMDMETYRAAETELYAVLTDGITGKHRYISNKECGEEEFTKAVEASASIPLLSPPVEIDGVPYVDGGLAMPLVPFPYELPFPAEKPVYILTRQNSYRKKSMPSVARKIAQAIWGKKYPMILESMCTIPERYNARIEKLLQLEAEGKIFVFRPEKTVTVKRAETNPAKLRQLHGEGYRIGMARFNELMRWIHA